jgi:DNA-binding MarR family transcriptional regulator
MHNKNNSLKETVDYHIKATWHGISRMYNQIAQKHDISQACGFVLINIDDVNGTPATKIAPLMGMEATSLTRLLKSMESDGLIFRQKDRFDGRMVRIFLTPKGVEKRKIARRVVRKFNNCVLASIPQSKLDVFFEVMGKINESIEEFRKIETV